MVKGTQSDMFTEYQFLSDQNYQGGEILCGDCGLQIKAQGLTLFTNVLVLFTQ